MYRYKPLVLYDLRAGDIFNIEMEELRWKSSVIQKKYTIYSKKMAIV